MSGLLALDSGECEYINEYNRNDYLYSIPERDSVINCKSLDIEQIRIRLSHLAKYVTKIFPQFPKIFQILIQNLHLGYGEFFADKFAVEKD